MRFAATALLLEGAACTSHPKPSQATPESPQANAEPAPLASPALPAEGRGKTLAGEALRGDREAPSDVIVARDPHDAAGRERDPKSPQGYAMQASLRWLDPPPVARAPEVNANAVEALRKRAEPRLSVELLPGRMRAIVGTGFLLPAGTEIRSRSDLYGALAYLPGEGGYHTIAPGALRAFLGEGRLDVAPQLGSETRPLEGGHRLGLPTRRVEVTTRAGHATLELAAFKDLADGGSLLCRALLDLVNAPPTADPCEVDELPLHAELRWTSRGGIAFEATSVERRADISAATVAVPSPLTPWMATAPHLPEAELLLSRSELASLHTSATDVAVAAGDARPPPPESGLLLTNSSDELRVAWLDGVPSASLAPGASVALPGLLRGRYQVQWRSFLGDSSDTARSVTVPGTSEPQ